MARVGMGLLLPAAALAFVGAGAPALAETVRASITRKDCARAVEYIPAPDVAYQPGVDVYGRPVTPADVDNSVRLKLPDRFVILLEIDLAHSGYPVPGPKGFNPKVELGVLTVEGNRVYLNGQPLDDPEQERIAAACRDLLKRKR